VEVSGVYQNWLMAKFSLTSPIRHSCCCTRPAVHDHKKSLL
jgi:hypothetical protein